MQNLGGQTKCMNSQIENRRSSKAESRTAPAQVGRDRSLESSAGKTNAMPYFVSILLQNKTKHFSNQRSILSLDLVIKLIKKTNATRFILTTFRHRPMSSSGNEF